MPFIGVRPVISRSSRSQPPRLLHSPSHLYISVWDCQLLKELSPSGRANSRRTKEDSSQATVPPLEATPSLFSLREDDKTQPTRRWLDRLAVPDSEDTLVGAPLAGFADHWQILLGECRSVQILRSGVLLQRLDQHRPLTRTPISFHTRNRKQDLQKAVDSLLQKGAIEPVLNSRSLGFYSRLFLVPKKTGDLRPVIDLSTLNKSLVVPHLQMEMAQTVRAAIRRQAWTLSIDTRDAYLHVPMNLSIQKYLRFHVNNRTYQIYMSTVWAGHLSKGIHQDPASSCPVASKAWGPSSCVFGQLADPGGFATVGEFPCAASDDSGVPSRMDHKSGEV